MTPFYIALLLSMRHLALQTPVSPPAVKGAANAEQQKPAEAKAIRN
jgi:hypothetical protein